MKIYTSRTLSIAQPDCIVLDRNPMKISEDGRTVHHFNETAKDLRSCLIFELGLDPGRADELIDLGSVYINQLRSHKIGNHLKPGDYVRAHILPKRHPLQTPTLLQMTEDWVIVDKPHGLPTHATLDNALENAQALCEKKWGEKLYTTYRLDTATSGVLIFARHPAAQSLMNKWLRERQLIKHYEALVKNPVTATKLVHYMLDSERAPKELRREPVEKSLRCELEILDQQRSGDYYSVKINLLTGRTHQIRAQLAFEGSPILGDTTYGSTEFYVEEGIALRCCRIQGPVGSTNRPDFTLNQLLTRM